MMKIKDEMLDEARAMAEVIRVQKTIFNYLKLILNQFLCRNLPVQQNPTDNATAVDF